MYTMINNRVTYSLYNVCAASFPSASSPFELETVDIIDIETGLGLELEA